jgi:hypothetical protein
MEVDFSGEYLTADNTKDGDVALILDEGEFVDNADKTRKIFNLKVQINGKTKIYSPWDKEGQILVKAWGNDTTNWIEKKFKVLHVAYQSFGNVKKKIVPEPIK